MVFKNKCSSDKTWDFIFSSSYFNYILLISKYTYAGSRSQDKHTYILVGSSL
jgi:hypothetical protein